MFAMGPAFFQASGMAPPATLAITGAFAAATVGVAYSSSLPITGGTEPYSLTGGTGIAAGSLDTGFALSITGSAGAYFLTLACASPATADTMSFTASVDSTDGQTATSVQSVAVSTNTYRYWRLLITANNGDTQYTTVCEVELRGTVGGSDLTSPSAATTAASASDDQGTGFWAGSAQAAFDDVVHYGGTSATRAQWLSNATPPTVGAPKWLKYDFGTPTTVAQLAITGSHDADSNPSATALKSFSIQGSNDNSTWTTLLTPPDQTGWTPAETRMFSLP